MPSKGGVTLCNAPNFVEAGFTLGKSSWEQDENDYLVLGYHNTNNKVMKHPTCTIRGTIPVDEASVGGGLRVAKWALPFIRNKKLVTQGNNNQRHNGVPVKSRKKRVSE